MIHLHFHRHDEVIVLDFFQRTLVITDVAGDDGNVLDIVASLFRRTQNVFALRRRITNGRNFTVGIAFGQVQRQGSPTTSQIDNLHAILDASDIAVLFEHGDFGFFKRRVWGRPQTRRILFAGTQTNVIEFGGNFVVLVL